MIDDIVEMILKEARSRDGKDLILNIVSVWSEIDDKIGPIVDQLTQDEIDRDFPELKKP